MITPTTALQMLLLEGVAFEAIPTRFMNAMSVSHDVQCSRTMNAERIPFDNYIQHSEENLAKFHEGVRSGMARISIGSRVVYYTDNHNGTGDFRLQIVEKYWEGEVKDHSFMGEIHITDTGFGKSGLNVTTIECKEKQ